MRVSDKPQGGPVSGRVVTPAGQPVSGAAVSWISSTEDGTAKLASAKTDAAGRFQFEHTERFRHKDDRPQLLVESAGWGLTFESIGDGREPVEISLVPPTELRATFVDAEGKPVPDLEVYPFFILGDHNAYFRFPANAINKFSRRTDMRGVASFPAMPQGGQVRIDTQDQRFARLEMENYPLGRGPVTELPAITLVPAATVRGRITIGPSGKPVARLRVGAQSMDGERPPAGGDAVSDSKGFYQLTQIRPGAYNIALDLNNAMGRSWTARAHEAVYVRPGDDLEGIDFQLIRGAILQGRVVAADNGAPIPGVWISVYGPAHPQSGAWVQGVGTGPDGAYLHRVPGGKQHLYLAMSAPPSGFRMPAQTAYDLTVRDGETVTIDFKLPRGRKARSVRGRVLGPEGKPVAGAEVIATSLGRFSSGSMALRADSHGDFHVNEQFLSQPLALHARYQDLATPTGVTVAGGESVTLRLQKNALASLSGCVTGPAGQPIAGAPVMQTVWTFDSGSGGVVANTDAQGRYALTGLWPDLRYSVGVTAKGFGQAYTQQLQLRPGEARELAPLVLKFADRSVTGRVVDENGDPMVGAQVNLDGRDSAQQYQAADSAGKFRFDGVVDEKVRVSAYRPGCHWAEKHVPAGSSDVILVLTKERDTKSSDAGAAVKEQFDALKGQPAPPLHAVAWINSPPRTMAQLRGKVVLIDFWGIGCGPCVAALPGVQRAADQLAAKGVIVIGLHAAGSSPAELGKFAREHHLTYPLAIDAPDGQNLSFGKTFREYTVVGIPSVAVIDRSGRVAYLGHSLDEAIGSLSPLLARASREAGGTSG